MTHDLWTNLNVTIFDYLSKVSLASLVEQQKAKDGKENTVLQDKRECSVLHASAASGAL